MDVLLQGKQMESQSFGIFSHTEFVPTKSRVLLVLETGNHIHAHVEHL
jgi:hypothetical protein